MNNTRGYSNISNGIEHNNQYKCCGCVAIIFSCHFVTATSPFIYLYRFWKVRFNALEESQKWRISFYIQLYKW